MVEVLLTFLHTIGPCLSPDVTLVGINYLLFIYLFSIPDVVQINSYLVDCKQRVTQYVVPFLTHTRTKETKPVVVGQVQGYVISSITFCNREVTLPYCFLGYHSLIPKNWQDVWEQLL